MTFEQALALYAVMPAADKYWFPYLNGYAREGCACAECAKQRVAFVASVSAKADEIEREMLAAQTTEGSA